MRVLLLAEDLSRGQGTRDSKSVERDLRPDGYYSPKAASHPHSNPLEMYAYKVNKSACDYRHR